MSSELLSVIIGGTIGITGGLATTLFVNILENIRRRRSIISVEAGEMFAIKEKAERYLAGDSSLEELKASTPMLISIASEIGYLSSEQVIAIRKVVTLDMEMRKKGNTLKAQSCIDACKEAIRLLHI